MFELPERLDLDAVIVPIGTVSGYLNNDIVYTNKLLHLLDPAKTLVLEREFSGYRCLTKDSISGMSDCVRYLIEEREVLCAL